MREVHTLASPSALLAKRLHAHGQEHHQHQVQEEVAQEVVRQIAQVGCERQRPWNHANPEVPALEHPPAGDIAHQPRQPSKPHGKRDGVAADPPADGCVPPQLEPLVELHKHLGPARGLGQGRRAPVHQGPPDDQGPDVLQNARPRRFGGRVAQQNGPHRHRHQRRRLHPVRRLHRPRHHRYGTQHQEEAQPASPRDEANIDFHDPVAHFQRLRLDRCLCLCLRLVHTLPCTWCSGVSAPFAPAASQGSDSAWAMGWPCRSTKHGTRSMASCSKTS